MRFKIFLLLNANDIVEMQAAEVDDLARRNRYYQGNIDADFLKKGGLYKDLKDSYVIFICCFDYFGKGYYKYTFKNYCQELPDICLNDGAVKIFLNTKGERGKISKSLKDFLVYTENSTDSFVKEADTPLVRTIHKRVSKVKENEDLGVNYMTMVMRDRMIKDKAWNEGRAEGKAEGKAEGGYPSGFRAS